ncbi:MAG TPA: hypothetical protein VJ742_12285 [Nitrososphaera sp.]|nr:hypothetical protein [Nitrososphaera sp.]
MAHLIEEITIGTASLKLKFLKTVKVSSIVNAAFQLYENASTPVSTPFEEIEIEEDFSTISRILSLGYTSALKPSTDYLFKVTGLKDAVGTTIEDENVTFTTPASIVGEVEVEADEVPVFVEDYSIKGAISDDIVNNVGGSNPAFYLTGYDPGDPFVSPDTNAGRVTIKFSHRPAGNYISRSYFQAQRKQVSRGMTRWQNVTTQVSLDGNRPWVYVDFPSLDATPVYVTPDKDYFEEGYKYRVKISKDVGT